MTRAAVALAALGALVGTGPTVARAEQRAAVVNVAGAQGAPVAARLRKLLGEQKRLVAQPDAVVAVLEGQPPATPDFEPVRKALAEFRYQDAERQLAEMIDELLARTSADVTRPLAAVFGWRGLVAAVDDRAKPQEQRRNAKQFFVAALALDEEIVIDPAMTSPRVRLYLEEARRQKPEQGTLQLSVALTGDKGGDKERAGDAPQPELSVDGKPSTSFGDAIELPVGWHLLRVTAPERTPVLRLVEISKSAPVRLQVELTRERMPDKVVRLVGETASVPEGKQRLAAARRLGDAIGTSNLLVLEAFEAKRAKIRLYDVGGQRVSQQFSFSQSDSSAAVSAAMQRAFEMSGGDGRSPRWYERWQVWAGAGAVVVAGVATVVIVSSLQDERVRGL